MGRELPPEPEWRTHDVSKLHIRHSAEIVELYQAGRTIRQIAALTGVSTGTVSAALEYAGVTARRTGPRPRPVSSKAEAVQRLTPDADTAARIAQLYAKGQSLRSLARRFDVVEDVLREILSAQLRPVDMVIAKPPRRRRGP